MQKSSDRKAKWRVGIAFFFLFASIVAALYGASFILSMSKLQEDSDAREGQEALQGASDAKGIEEALRAHPQNRFLQFIATATRAADETDAALEKLSNDMAPPLASKNINLANASRDDLDALRRDLKVAEANATTFLPRYAALLKRAIPAYRKRHGQQIFAERRQAARRDHGLHIQDVAGARQFLPRLCELCRDAGRRIRRLQDSQRSVHLPVSSHRGPLQRCGPGHERRRKARRRIGAGKSRPGEVASGAMDAVREREMTPAPRR